MSNKIKAILMAAAVSSMVLTQGVSAAQFDDGEQIFTDGTESSDATGSVSALASALAKQTEEETQKFVEKEEEAAQIREERRVEKAEKASEQAEQDKTAALEAIQQTVEDARKKAEEEAEAQRVAKRQAVVDFALQFEGNPYVYGGTSLTNGADCSGFVMSVYANFGVGLPHSSAADRNVGSAVPSLAEAQPGDIICYSGHVGIYAGDGMLVHASTSKTGIIISSATYRNILSIRRIF